MKKFLLISSISIIAQSTGCGISLSTHSESEYETSDNESVTYNLESEYEISDDELAELHTVACINNCQYYPVYYLTERKTIEEVLEAYPSCDSSKLVVDHFQLKSNSAIQRVLYLIGKCPGDTPEEAFDNLSTEDVKNFLENFCMNNTLSVEEWKEEWKNSFDFEDSVYNQNQFKDSIQFETRIVLCP